MNIEWLLVLLQRCRWGRGGGKKKLSEENRNKKEEEEQVSINTLNQVRSFNELSTRRWQAKSRRKYSEARRKKKFDKSRRLESFHRLPVGSNHLEWVRERECYNWPTLPPVKRNQCSWDWKEKRATSCWWQPIELRSWKDLFFFFTCRKVPWALAQRQIGQDWRWRALNKER